MKWFWLIVANILFWVSMGLLSKAHASDWTAGDTVRQGIFTALDVMDWAQTRYGSTHGFTESNPILGSHPSLGRINTVFAIGLVGNAAVSWVIPKEYRPYFQYGSIALEAYCVGHNARIGVKFQW